MRTVSSSLHLLHSLYGPFSKVHGIGRFSKVPRLRLLEKYLFNISSTTVAIVGLNCSVQMVNKCWRQQVEEGEQKSREAKIGTVFLIDRGETHTLSFHLWATCRAALHSPQRVFADVDYVTPLCSQVVYEGLVDDIFRIKCGGYE